MKKLEILGTGCPKCNQLYEQSEAAAKELGIDYTIGKVSDINEILDRGVMMTPALMVNEQVKVVGRVPNLDELKKLIGG